MHPLERILTENLDKLYRYAYRETGDSWLAEDLTQETVLRAWSTWDSLKDKSAATAWLWGILRNLIRQSWRKPRDIPTETEELTRIADGCGVSWETPETAAVRKWEITRVREAVAYLAAIYRQVCVAYYLEEKDTATIAKKLGIPLSSVKWRLHRSRIELRKEICEMEFMEKKYRAAVPLLMNMGGTVQHWEQNVGCYDGADKALEGLLAQNICQAAYEKPVTVTEIASDLGVAADYVEEVLAKLVSTQCIRQKANTYQTAFPILTREQTDQVFREPYQSAARRASELIDLLYSSEPAIRRVGFYGSDQPMDKLMLMLIGWLAYNTEGNRFDVDKLPFHGVEKSWYILATTAPAFREKSEDDCVGLNSNGSLFGFVEFYLAQPHFPDNRSSRTEEQRVMEALYLGNKTYVEEHKTELAHLIESGKAEPCDDGYRLTVPVLSVAKGEWRALREALAPALALTNQIQGEMNESSAARMQQVIPAHLADQRGFFATYCTHGALLVALYRALMNRGLTVTREMPTWLSVDGGGQGSYNNRAE